MYQAPSPAVLLRALLLATLANAPLVATAASPEQAPATADPAGGTASLRVTQADTEDFRAAIAALESESGAYSSALPEQLLSLGLALQQQGRHDDAIAVFRRGVHLDRINNGLYSPQQVRLLQREIASLVATGNVAEADERQHYMYRVQMRNLNSGVDRSQAFMAQADWQYNAYLMDLGEAPHLRLMSMWDLNRLALNDIIKTQGETSPALLEPLDGMLLAQYLISHYESGGSTNSQGELTIGLQQQSNRFYRYQRESYKRGRAVIQAIYDLRAVVYGENSQETVDAMMMMGDWTLWHGESDAALLAYQKAQMELAERGADQDTIDRAFAEPVALPNFDGVYPLPQTVPPGDSTVQLAFTVTAKGKVRNLERVDSNELNDSRANKLMRTLRRTRFRPQLAMGEPVDTERVLRAYEIQ